MLRVMKQSVVTVLALQALAGLAHAQAQPVAPTLPLPGAPVTAPAPAAVSVPVNPDAALPPIAPAPGNAASVPAFPSVAEPEPQTRQYSYGASNLSVLFLPEEVNRMKKALRTFEDTNNRAKPAVFLDVDVAQPVEKIEEPPSYPVFYLSSIVYDAPNDWSIWVAGYKITPRRNDTDVTVLSVRPDSVTFSWSPTYGKVIDTRIEEGLFAPVDAVKNKIASSQQFNWDSENARMTFTLKQNQAFSLGYYKVFEGFVPSPAAMPGLPVPTPINGVDVSATAPPATGTAPISGPASEKIDVEELLKKKPANATTP